MNITAIKVKAEYFYAVEALADATEALLTAQARVREGMQSNTAAAEHTVRRALIVYKRAHADFVALP